MIPLLKTLQLQLVKMKVETTSVFRPRFAVTTIVMWMFAVAGLLTGRIWGSSADQTISILLCVGAALGALFILLLQRPLERLKLYLRQVWGYCLLLSLGVIGFVLTTSVRSVGSNSLILVIWGIVGVGIAYVGLRQLVSAYHDVTIRSDAGYPGMRSASILAIIAIGNYLLWLGHNVVRIVG